MSKEEIKNKIEEMMKELESLKKEVEIVDENEDIEELKGIKRGFVYIAKLQIEITNMLLENIIDDYNFNFSKIIPKEKQQQIEEAQGKIEEIVDEVMQEIKEDFEFENDFYLMLDYAEIDFTNICDQAKKLNNRDYKGKKE